MQALSIGESRSQVMYSIGVCAFELSELFSEDIDSKIIKL